ncbi:MAG: PH domain-containing protein [Planctomycetes bacterium]|nr:PH domain-containing protein [Planctomycetota bacterium]
MECAKCRVTLPQGSAFCNACGAPQGAPPAAPPPPAPERPEEILWTGRFSPKATGHWWVLWFLWLSAVIYLRFFAISPGEHVKIANIAALSLVGLPALALLWHIAIQRLSIRYRLTTHRLFKETGLISRHMNEVELIRVDDVSVRQNVVQRLFNVGVVTIISTDATDPRLDLEGIDNPIEIKEKIRTHVRERRARTLHMESL